MLLGSHKARNRWGMSLAMSSRNRWFSASIHRSENWSSILRCMASHTGWATILFAMFMLSHSFPHHDQILLAPRYLATICVRMIWLTCSYPSTLRRLSISPSWDYAVRLQERRERFGIRYLTSWFVLSLTSHPLAFLSVYTEDSAQSRSHVEEVLILPMKKSEESIKNSIYCV